MDITPFIRELVVLNECVILRGFGGFDSSYKHAEYDDQRRKILPPGKIIKFRADWIKDNGMLEAHISSSLDVSRDEASRIIDEYVEDLQQKLRSDGNLRLEGIGQFTLDNEQNIFFSSPDNVNFLADSFGLEVLEIEQEAVTPEIPEVVTTKPMEAIPINRRRYTGWYVVIGSLLLLILVSILIYLSGARGVGFFSGKNNGTQESDMIIFGPKTRAEEDPMTKKISKSLDEQTSVKEALSLDSEPVSTEANAAYILVAGTFKSEKNAQKLCDRLKRQGFTASVITTGQLLRVTLGQFSNKKEALDELQRIKGQMEQPVWLMERR